MLKKSIVLSLIVVLLFANISNLFGRDHFDGYQDRKEKPHFTVDVMPSFPGGEKAMQEFIGANLVYPKEVQDASVEGKVVVRFVVTRSGQIEDVVVVRGIHPLCDQAAKDVVKKMPKWNPGKKNGRFVPVYFTLPLVFRLVGEDDDVDKKTLITVPDNYIYIVNGVEVSEKDVKTVPKYRVEKMDVFEKDKVKALLKKYGEEGAKKEGIVLIILKKIIL